MSIIDGLSFDGQDAPARTDGTISTNEDFVASLNRDLGLTDEAAPPAAPPADETVPAPAGETPPAPAAATPPGDAYDPDEKELKNLHAVLARQAEELGQLRKLAQEREAAPPPAEEPTPYAPPPITPDVVMQIEEALENQPGEQLAYWALTQAPHLYETILDTWADQGGSAARKAAEFNFNYQQALKEEQARTETQSQQEFQQTLATQLDQQVAALAPDYGLTPGTPETDQLLADVISDMPPAIQRLVVSRDEAERRDGLMTVLQVAAARAAVPTTPTGADPAATAAALAVAKGAAAIGGGSLRPAAGQGEGGGSQDPPDLLDALQSAILETPTTSVAAGLTFGSR